jgi:hypothetical protein
MKTRFSQHIFFHHAHQPFRNAKFLLQTPKTGFKHFLFMSNCFIIYQSLHIITQNNDLRQTIKFRTFFATIQTRTAFIPNHRILIKHIGVLNNKLVLMQEFNHILIRKFSLVHRFYLVVSFSSLA